MKNLYKLPLIALLTFLSCSAVASTLNLSKVPLFIGSSATVPPNVMFTLDDSGSMQWELSPLRFGAYYMFPRPANMWTNVFPNYIPTFNDNRRMNFRTRSSHQRNNTIFYNPDTTYSPWANPDGSLRANANPRNAFYNEVRHVAGGLDLLVQQTQFASIWQGRAYNSSEVFQPITYYKYTGSDTAPESVFNSRSSYIRVQIGIATPASANFSYLDDAGNVAYRTRDEEIQNFANWFQYYRSRYLTALGGVGHAFAAQDDNSLRVGFATLNKGNGNIDGINTTVVRKGVRLFFGAEKANFFNALYNSTEPLSGTPLRPAVNAVGRYFKRADNKGPWSSSPGISGGGGHASCRQNYHLLMTDGAWYGGHAGVGNVDGSAGATMQNSKGGSYTYSPGAPYRDSVSNTLADHAMKFWVEDLRPDLTNNVPVNNRDEAFWQHLTHVSIGLGVKGNLNPADYPDPLTASSAPAWPLSSSFTVKDKTDDFWHASVNGRGPYLDASNVTELTTKLSALLKDIVSFGQGSASAVTVNSPQISSGSKVYQPSFTSEGWSGDLIAKTIIEQADKLVFSSKVWSAADQLLINSNRKIITYDGANGVPFRWASLSANQKLSLGSAAVLLYLRGGTPDASFRSRDSLLGDIVHSAPVYIGKPVKLYPDTWAGGAETAYSTFKTSNSARAEQIYVGANDGMLHAFNATTGEETFAYVPKGVYGQLAELKEPDYNHEYYVDEAPVVSDAFFGGSWHTVLVSGLGGGGQSIFALDVTDPSSFSSESSSSSKVLWEFTDDNLGYTFGTPSIVRLHNGEWAAVFSGGYNNTKDNDSDGSPTGDSTTGNAVLYIVNIATGALIKKFDTKVGMAEDPTGNSRPNGLAEPAVVDVDGDYISDLIYVGDLFGNVWKVDISGPKSTWGFAQGSNLTPKPFYKACAGTLCTNINSQPITSKIEVTQHASGAGYSIFFGTGKYIENFDNTSIGQVTQSFYSLWDKDEAPANFTQFNKSDLLQQKILAEVTHGGSKVRITSQELIDDTYMGWYMDLVNTQSGNTNNHGERIITKAVTYRGQVALTTMRPVLSADSCDTNSLEGATMILNASSGARFDEPVFDLNSDGTFTQLDKVTVMLDGVSITISASGIITKGSVSGSIIVSGTGAADHLITNTVNNDLSSIMVRRPASAVAGGRESWRQLQ